eukprot:CCRYP_017608-RA/>CCRYP_017608-RA protein AED:0.41 eAED:0.57 QI:0/0/0/1/0/0/2/0/92
MEHASSLLISPSCLLPMHLHRSVEEGSYLLVFHKVLISVPRLMIRVGSFLAMIGQIPLIILTKKIDRRMPDSSIGIMVFWILFCLVVTNGNV